MRLRMAALAVGSILVSNPGLALPARPASPLASFDWTYRAEPEPGLRHWTSPDGVVWIETYPDGHAETQVVGAVARVGGCRGVITTKADSPTAQTFIPDPGCPQMVLMFRFGNEPWRAIGIMRSITLRRPQSSAPLAPPPSPSARESPI